MTSGEEDDADHLVDGCLDYCPEFCNGAEVRAAQRVEGKRTGSSQAS